MASSCTFSASAPAWRRSPQSKSFSKESAEFVPSWEKKAAALEAASGSTPTGTSPSIRRPWRAAASEFVPRSFQSAVSSGTLSTCEGSAGSGDDSVSTPSPSSAASRSPSPSPVPTPDAVPLSLHSMMQWRHTAPSERLEIKLPFAAAPEPDTPEAAIAAYAAEAAASVSPPTLQEARPLSLHAMMQWRHTTPSEHLEVKLPFAAAPELGTPEAAVAAYAAEAAASTDTAAPPRLRLAPGGGTPSFRRPDEPSSGTPTATEEKCWRNVAPAKKLEVSDGSWAAKQRHRRSSGLASDANTMSDEEVVRAMKSILNKLTVEKFDSLSVQLIHCGIRNALHLELLIVEIFEKATTQHHFIDMYADLCVLLNKSDIINDPKVSFKKILLSCCQASFEKNLTPPSLSAELNSEDRTIAENLYKTRMLGNIRFVGALLVRKMLASKVMLAIMQELLQDPTPEALESLAAFLTVVSPAFDSPDWPYITSLNAIFKQVEKLTKKSSVPNRVRCLLKDVVELRNLGWRDRRPKKIEGPMKLDEVANGGAVKAGSGEDHWAVVGGSRVGKVSSPVSCTNKQQQGSVFFPQKAQAEKPKQDMGAGQAMLMFMKCREKEESSKKDKVPEPKTSTRFDHKVCRAEISATLAELRVSHDVPDAILRIANIAIPVSHQASELDWILATTSEEASQDTRKLGFTLAAGLFLEKHWKSEAATEGISKFVGETCEDLKCDVPALPKIVRDELHPALAPLEQANLLGQKLRSSLLSV